MSGVRHFSCFTPNADLQICSVYICCWPPHPCACPCGFCRFLSLCLFLPHIQFCLPRLETVCFDRQFCLSKTRMTRSLISLLPSVSRRRLTSFSSRPGGTTKRGGVIRRRRLTYACRLLPRQPRLAFLAPPSELHGQPPYILVARHLSSQS